MSVTLRVGFHFVFLSILEMLLEALCFRLVCHARLHVSASETFSDIAFCCLLFCRAVPSVVLLLMGLLFICHTWLFI